MVPGLCHISRMQSTVGCSYLIYLMLDEMELAFSCSLARSIAPDGQEAFTHFERMEESAVELEDVSLAELAVNTLSLDVRQDIWSTIGKAKVLQMQYKPQEYLRNHSILTLYGAAFLI